jgi:acid phosphatase family membrane protein YuiD
MQFFPLVSVSLVAAVCVQLICQAFKYIFYSIREGRSNFSYFLSAGGMPSSHSAFVTALTVSVGLRGGFNTEVFAAAFVFSAIVIYDSYRLRGAVENHARMLKKLAERHPDVDAAGITEMVGHSPLEILAGIGFGGGAAVLLRLTGV